jgi:hypothetical protein
VGHRDRTYTIFDGDNDMWAYAFMKGWKVNDRVDFDFVDAHDLWPMTVRADDEGYIKARLKERLEQSKQVLVLVGENTKRLHKFVRWEIDAALDLGLPVIVVNVNGQRRMDHDRCPPILMGEDAVHVSFNRAIIRYALDNFPTERVSRRQGESGSRYYNDDVYAHLAL